MSRTGKETDAKATRRKRPARILTRKGTRRIARDRDLPGRVEIIDGKLYLEGTTPERLLGLLLEYLGTDKALTIGDLSVWFASFVDLLTDKALAAIEAKEQAGKQGC